MKVSNNYNYTSSNYNYSTKKQPSKNPAFTSTVSKLPADATKDLITRGAAKLAAAIEDVYKGAPTDGLPYHITFRANDGGGVYQPPSIVMQSLKHFDASESRSCGFNGENIAAFLAEAPGKVEAQEIMLDKRLQKALIEAEAEVNSKLIDEPSTTLETNVKSVLKSLHQIIVKDGL